MTKKNYLLLSLFLLLGFMAEAQMATLRSQTKTAFLENISSNDPINYALGLLSIQNSTTGSFNLDYQDLDDNDCISGSATGGWEPESHLENLADMAEGYARILIEQPNNTSNANAIANALVLGLQYWYSLNETTSLPSCPMDGAGDCDNMDPEGTTVPSVPWCCDNWFKNYISKQRELSKIGILFQDYLIANVPTVPNSNATKTLLRAIIEDLPEDVFEHDQPTQKYTGANLTDIASFVLVRGILSYDYTQDDQYIYTDPNNPNNNIDNPASIALVNLAVQEFEERALTPASLVSCNKYDDGVQTDHSFFQHRKVLYSSGYGYSFIRSLSIWGSALRSTDYDFGQDHKDFLLDAVLEGWRWMIRGNTADYSASGRYITRSYPNNHSAIPEQHMVWLIEMAEGVGYDCLDPGDPNYVAPVTDAGIALEDMKINAQNGQAQNIQGNKYFWKSDYVVHHEPAYFSSVKMCAYDPFTIVGGCDNGDVINARTSGTESRGDDNEEGYWLPYGCTFIYQNGTEYNNIFDVWDWAKVPGVTSPNIVLKPGRGGSDASTQSSDFVGVASNGNYGVTAMDLDKTYEDLSGANQNIKAKKAWFHFGEEIIALGAGITATAGINNIHTTINQTWKNGNVTQNQSGTTWIQHDNIAYVFPDNPDVQHSTASQKFTAWIQHGANTPDYYYIIAPGQNPTNYDDTDTPITKIKNTPTIQAVKKVEQDGDVLAGIIFYPGFEPLTEEEKEIEVTPNLKMYTDKPCALLYDGSIGQVCISSPLRDESSLVLTVKETIGTVETPHTITFDLPAGDFAGTSTCMTLFSNSKGSITSHCMDNEGINEVEILPFGTFTNSSGNYAITKLLPGGLQELSPFKDINYLNGVDADDITKIAYRILGIQSLDSQYKKIAADVNNTGTITTFDMVLIRKLILGIDEEFQAVNSWRFVDEDFTTTIPLPSYQVEPFPESILVNQNQNNADINFKGVKMGDVTCDAMNELAPGPAPGPEIIIVDKTVVKDQVIEVAFQVENFSQIEAYQLGIEFNAAVLEKQSINPADLNGAAKADNFGLTEVQNGKIKSLWLYNEATDPNYTVTDTTLIDSSSIFKIEFKALTDYTRSSDSGYKLSDLIRLNDDILANKAFSQRGVHNIKLTFVSADYFDKTAKEKILLSPVKCFPNPADEEINFQLDLSKAADVHLQIFDPIGKLVIDQEMTLSAGVQIMDIKNIEKWQDGLYYYVVRIGDEIESGKFVKQ